MAANNDDSSSESNEENPIQDSVLSPELEDALESIVQKFEAESVLLLKQQHKFWETQPVGQFKDLLNSNLQEGPIEQPTPLSEVRKEPYNLPDLYEWTVCDMGSDDVCNEVYLLLMNNYVEDDGNLFRFNYSKEFLRWGLRPPGYFPSWHLGVRVNASKKLVAFITGIPVKMKVRDEVVQMAEVNFLCVHKKLRSKRLTPAMIKEITRRIHLENIWQAAYTGGVLLPTPITDCEYWHRTLNPKKLIDIGFSELGQRMTMSRTMKNHKLPNSTSTPGLRKMGLGDVPSVTVLLRNYLKKFVVAPIFDDEEVAHWLLPREDVVESYVVESLETREITDFFSFYTIHSSILGNLEYSTLKAAYSFYSVSTRTPLVELMQDALVVAKEKDFDVFNALDVMENRGYLKELKFLKSDGQLYYYLYNYRLRSGLLPSQLGLVLL